MGATSTKSAETQCSNPHMHLLEAFLKTSLLAFTMIFGLIELVNSLLATNRMIQPEMIVLPEYFDNRWTPIRHKVIIGLNLVISTNGVGFWRVGPELTKP